MKRYILITAVLFNLFFGYSQNIDARLSVTPMNNLKITITNNSQYAIFITGPLSIADDAGNMLEPTRSYYSANLYDIQTNNIVQISEKRYFGRTKQHSMFLPILPGHSYEIFEWFCSNNRVSGLFGNISGTFRINVVLHLEFLYASTPNVVTQMDITSNAITFSN
ncbi:hypothetical protein FACS189429_7390 [Bacteroidia bacterium]|nr:hypothetical protein FACS189429_7390 [Bacteroidia bacterium]